MKHAIAILASVFSIAATAAPVQQATHLWTTNKINEIVGTNTAAKIASATNATLTAAKSYTDAAIQGVGVLTPQDATNAATAVVQRDVPNWARQPNPPAETDPTVPSWAKAGNPPEETDPTVASWARSGQPQPQTSLEPATNYTDACCLTLAQTTGQYVDSSCATTRVASISYTKDATNDLAVALRREISSRAPGQDWSNYKAKHDVDLDGHSVTFDKTDRYRLGVDEQTNLVFHAGGMDGMVLGFHGTPVTNALSITGFTITNGIVSIRYSINSDDPFDPSVLNVQEKFQLRDEEWADVDASRYVVTNQSEVSTLAPTGTIESAFYRLVYDSYVSAVLTVTLSGHVCIAGDLSVNGTNIVAWMRQQETDISGKMSAGSIDGRLLSERMGGVSSNFSAMAIGRRTDGKNNSCALATTNGAFAAGYGAKATGLNSSVLGSGTATTNYSVVVAGGRSDGYCGVAVTGGQCDGKNSIALGEGKVTGHDSTRYAFAMGRRANATKTRTIVIDTDESNESQYYDHGVNTINIRTKRGLADFYIGEERLSDIINDVEIKTVVPARGTVISVTNSDVFVNVASGMQVPIIVSLTDYKEGFGNKFSVNVKNSLITNLADAIRFDIGTNYSVYAESMDQTNGTLVARSLTKFSFEKLGDGVYACAKKTMRSMSGYTVYDYVQDGLIAMYDVQNWHKHGDKYNIWFQNFAFRVLALPNAIESDAYLSGMWTKRPTITERGLIANSRGPQWLSGWQQAWTNSLAQYTVESYASTTNNMPLVSDGDGSVGVLDQKSGNYGTVNLKQSSGTVIIGKTTFSGSKIAEPSTLTARHDGTYASAFQDGEQIGSSVAVGFTKPTYAGYTSQGYCIRCIRLYNRPLTDEEIRLNAEIDRFRYGGR